MNKPFKKLPSPLFAAFLLVLCLALFACAENKALTRAEILPYQGTVNVDILKQSIGFGNVSSLKAHSEVSITKQGEYEGAMNGVFAYKAPGKARLSLFGPFGLTMAEIVMSNELLQFSVPSKNLLYEWASPEISFAGLLDSRFRYELGVEADRYVLVALTSGGSQPEVAAKYCFDRTYLLNRAMYFYKDGREIIKAELSDFNGRVPERIRLILANGLELSITLQEPEFGADIPEEYFRALSHGDRKIKSFQEIFEDYAPAP